MTDISIRRFALILAVQAEIEGMKAANSQSPQDQPYTDEQFKCKSVEMQNLAYCPDEKL